MTTQAKKNAKTNPAWAALARAQTFMAAHAFTFQGERTTDYAAAIVDASLAGDAEASEMLHTQATIDRSYQAFLGSVET